MPVDPLQAGVFVFGYAVGIPIGSYPSCRKYGDSFLVACDFESYANSRVGSREFQFLGLLLQNIDKYASISWLDRSVAPSV